jgi:hypothetical protein
MTKIPPKLPKYQKYSWNHQNDQNSSKVIKITLKVSQKKTKMLFSTKSDVWFKFNGVLKSFSEIMKCLALSTIKELNLNTFLVKF